MCVCVCSRVFIILIALHVNYTIEPQVYYPIMLYNYYLIVSSKYLTYP